MTDLLLAAPPRAHRAGARRWSTSSDPGPARAFHATLPGYRPTPLVGAPGLAAGLGVAQVWVEEEADRFGLPAFKILGASWAVNRALSARAGHDGPAGSLDGGSSTAAPRCSARSTTSSTSTWGGETDLVAVPTGVGSLLHAALRHYRSAARADRPAVLAVEPAGAACRRAHRARRHLPQGFIWAEVTLTGVAAHGSRPDLGVDAIVEAGAFLTGLGRLAADLGARPGHPLLGTGSVHAGVISGGQETSSYPDRCRITVERRTVPGESSTTFAAELRGILDPIVAGRPGLDHTIAVGLERHPLDGDPTQGIGADLGAAVAAVTGRPARHRGEAFWTDAALLAGAGNPSVLFGVGGTGAHAASEWVDLQSLHDATAVLGHTVSGWCR